MRKVTGPVTYRAACGDAFIDNSDMPKGKRMGRMVMGWKGDARTRNMKEDSLPPERCIGCPKLRKDKLQLLDESTKQFYEVPVWSCYTYTAVDLGNGTPSKIH